MPQESTAQQLSCVSVSTTIGFVKNHGLSRAKKLQRTTFISFFQPSHNPLSSSVWGNTGGSLSASWGPAANSGNIWGAAPPKPPYPQSYDEDDDEDDDDDSDDDDDEEDEEDDDGNGGSFWDDAVKAASKSQQQQRQQQPPVQQRQQQQPR